MREIAKRYAIPGILIAAVLAMIITIVIAGAAPDALCREDVLLCVREWISAFSGWAAAFLALAAALIAIPPLREQVAEARKQSAFQLGDAEPTIDLYPSMDPLDGGLFEIRVTNWNRRALDISEITVDIKGGAFRADVLEMMVDGRLSRRGRSITPEAHRVLRFTTTVFVPGWENRSASPSVFTADINVDFDEAIVLPARRTVVATVAADRGEGRVELCGERTFDLAGPAEARARR